MAAAIPIAAAVIGGMMASDAAESAADTQAQAADRASAAQLTAAREANALQERMYNQNRADAGPWRGAGVNALAKLQYGLGLPYQNVGTSTAPTGTAPKTIEQIVQELRGQASPQVLQGSYYGPSTNADPYVIGTPLYRYPDGTIGPEPVKMQKPDEASLMAKAQQIYGAQGTQGGMSGQETGATWQPGAGDPEAGYLSRDFRMSDYQADPGYGFRLSEGMKALERSAAARGGLMSGAALKGISRYSQDYASNEFTNAFNRYMQQRGNQYNQLASMAGLGQTATANLGAAGQTYAGNVGNNLMTGAARSSDALMSGAAARASGYVGGANAMNQGIGGAINTYQQNELMNRLLPQTGSNIYSGYDTYNDPWGGP